MFSKQYRAIIAALEGGKVDAHALAKAICDSTQGLEHKGVVTLRGGLPVEDRGYSSEDGFLKPDPAAVNLGPMDAAVLTIENQAEGHSDREGSNGYAINAKGIVRADQLWATRWATVVSTGQTASGYHYSDGFECNDALGADVTETPIRVFYQSASSIPTAGSVVGYLRDQKGIPYAQVGCSASVDTVTATVISAMQVAGGKVQYKTKVLTVLASDAESAWTDAEGQSSFTTQTVLTDFYVSGTALYVKHRNIYVNYTGSEATELVHTGTECS